MSDDGLIRDLSRIAKYARKNEDDDYRFRTFLKVQLPMANVALDGLVQELSTTVSEQIPCTSCGNCCRTLQIVVDDSDIKRLATRLSLSIKVFTERYIGVAPDRAKHFTAIPCPFLSAEGLCTVYEDRPRSCREYPFLDRPDFRSRTLMMIESTATCPIVFNVWSQLKQRLKTEARPPRRRRR